ncbi:MAG: tRNA 2-thiouridine(34) synthase MnmA, partial [Candidatus Cloacimonetes bacterium]|nr:tRNA 2-thiouridine(34) synthase MnmA [Candidatus Cloacimonadota bacterium]
MKVAVAMSGGVDSSVTAVILQRKDHDIIGVTMRHYNYSEHGFSKDESIETDIKDAVQVCEKLGILHSVIDTSKDFKKIVEENFTSEYSKGRTPNPCTLCNPTIKWGSLLDKVLELGVEKFATGHYVDLRYEKGTYNIYKASDVNKDQSYMLWALNQKQLSKTLFPIAKYLKSDVRKIALEMELPVHEKDESQEICFIKGHYEDYLKNHLKLTRGKVVLSNGKEIGEHRGLPLYTIGQRKGLNTPWRCPLYVLKLDVEKNQVVVTENPDDLLKDSFYIEKVNWISGSQPDKTDNLTVQIRYNSQPVAIQSITLKNIEIMVKLKSPTRAITPGQSAVFYS